MTKDIVTYYPHSDEYLMAARMLDIAKDGIIIPLNCLSQVIEQSCYNTFRIIILNDNPEMAEIKKL